jgi:predicted DCC family thiol-disulfide oxidoreductase YuxK
MALPAAATDAGHGQHLVLYDGVCGLCNSVCQFILARDRHACFDFASLQSATGRSWLERFGRDPNALDSFCLIANYRTAPALLDKSDAALAVAGALGATWSWLGVFRVLPGVVRTWMYDFVARHRYRWFGRYDLCLMPSPEQRARFLDV